MRTLKESMVIVDTIIKQVREAERETLEKAEKVKGRQLKDAIWYQFRAIDMPNMITNLCAEYDFPEKHIYRVGHWNFKKY
jgi:hypothetical protein